MLTSAGHAGQIDGVAVFVGTDRVVQNSRSLVVQHRYMGRWHYEIGEFAIISIHKYKVVAKKMSFLWILISLMYVVRLLKVGVCLFTFFDNIVKVLSEYLLLICYD